MIVVGDHVLLGPAHRADCFSPLTATTPALGAGAKTAPDDSVVTRSREHRSMAPHAPPRATRSGAPIGPCGTVRLALVQFAARSCQPGVAGQRAARVRILVVEDERHMATALVRGLTAEGYAVDLARSGDSALQSAQEHDYDAIVLDLMLPGLDGYQVCTALRDEQNWVPILVLTAKEGETDEARALNTGADDFLSKPFSFVVLSARLQALLRRGARERPAVLGAGDLSLDPGTGSCRRGKVDIVLTAREFAVLEYPLRHARQVA